MIFQKFEDGTIVYFALFDSDIRGFFPKSNLKREKASVFG